MVISTDYEKICDDFRATASEYGIKNEVIEYLVYDYMHNVNSHDIEVITEQIANEITWQRERRLWE